MNSANDIHSETKSAVGKKRPNLSKGAIWNMSLGFLGIQMGFALQNANASRILSIFGADVHELSWFWIVAPLTGLFVQPIIGHYSDNTWTRLGRRRPFFLIGAILASIALVLLPQADLFIAFLPSLWVGAGFLMIMDASFNVAMEPFRALIADKLNTDQQTVGFSIQTALIGIGAVVGSWLPYCLANWFGVSNEASVGEVPLNLLISFIFGAAVLITTILITVFTTSEYTPQEMAEFSEVDLEKSQTESTSLLNIFTDIKEMPKTMKQLAWVQFFSWFGLFGMWVFSTHAIAHHIYGLPTSDTSSKMFQDAGDWVGIMFGVYNAVSAVFAMLIPTIARKFGRKQTHALALFLGGIGLLSYYVVPNEYWLLGSMILVGIAWASILAIPYAILAGSIPSHKMGVYMGIFNLFIVLPQILNALIGGPLVKYLYGGNPVFSLVAAGMSFILAAFLVRRVEDSNQGQEITVGIGGGGH